MAGDGGRVPEMSEQRADTHEAGIEAAVRGWEAAEDAGHTRIDVLLRRAIQDYLARVSPAPDPASVLAALLAESPEATVAAIEALLTSDQAMDAGLDGTHGYGAPITSSEIRAALRAACRSLLSKAPKEDGDA
jgi:hypothetical protein